jgi:hypothetical protein
MGEDQRIAVRMGGRVQKTANGGIAGIVGEYGGL